MNLCVRKTGNLFERKGSHTFCVSKAIIRIEENDSDEIRHIDLKASGVAVCNKIDEFNLEFGKALAQSRADKRLDRKIEKFLVKLSEENEKKKMFDFTKEEIEKLKEYKRITVNLFAKYPGLVDIYNSWRVA